LVSKVIFFDNTKEKKLELGGTCFVGGWKTQFYIHLIYKPEIGTWFLLFGLFGQLKAVMKKKNRVFLTNFWLKKMKHCSVCTKKLIKIKVRKSIYFLKFK
jgi:hypothetical protein